MVFCPLCRLQLPYYSTVNQNWELHSEIIVVKQVLFCISYGLQMTAIYMVDSFKINFINRVD